MGATYRTSSGGAVRVIGNNLLVRPAPPRAVSPGGVIFANVETANAHAVGEVVAIGYLTGDRAVEGTTIPGLKIGDRVMYLRLLGKMHATGYATKILEDGVVRIRPSDILLVMDAEDADRVQ